MIEGRSQMIELDIHKMREVMEKERGNLIQTFLDSHEGDDGLQNSDEMDLALQSANRDIRLSLGQHNEEIVARIDQALKRLEAGTYGHCLGCGEEIAVERLMALPFAELCVRCQSRQEDRK